MIRLIKYDGISDKSVKAILTSGSGSSSGTDTPSRGGESVTLDRTIWGQNDTGDDIDGSMTVNGDINIKCIIPPSYEDDEDDEDGDGEDEEIEEGGGNLNVELKITSNEVESNEIYAKKTLYIPHPSTKAKTDIVELLKGYDSRITNNTTNIASNKTEIDALKNRVGTAETNITNLTTKVNNNTTAITNNTTNIQANADEIEKLKDSIDAISGDLGNIDLSSLSTLIQQLQQDMKVVKYGNYSHPIVLLSGKIRKYSYASASNTFSFSGCKSELITDLAISVDGGTMYLTPTFADNTSVYINAIHVTQEMSGDTADNSTATKSLHSSAATINGRNDGAHWFEAYYDDKQFKIREFHQKDGNNDSWGNDYWGGDGGGIRAINITVIGYLFQIN